MTEFFWAQTKITNHWWKWVKILCGDKVLECFGMWARACWHQETNALSDFQPSGKAELGSALQSRCWDRCAVLSERERARAAALLCSELRPCCNIPAVLRCRSPLQGVCCSDASLPASAVCVGCDGCVLALRVSPRVGCYLHQLSEVEARPLP